MTREKQLESMLKILIDELESQIIAQYRRSGWEDLPKNKMQFPSCLNSARKLLR